MNYEFEVKKVYPDAAEYDCYGLWIEIRTNASGRNNSLFLAQSTNTSAAWQSAYERLKNKE